MAVAIYLTSHFQSYIIWKKDKKHHRLWGGNMKWSFRWVWKLAHSRRLTTIKGLPYSSLVSLILDWYPHPSFYTHWYLRLAYWKSRSSSNCSLFCINYSAIAQSEICSRNSCKKKVGTQNYRDKIIQWVGYLHVTNLGSFPSILCGSPSPTKNNSCTQNQELSEHCPLWSPFQISSSRLHWVWVASLPKIWPDLPVLREHMFGDAKECMSLMSLGAIKCNYPK